MRQEISCERLRDGKRVAVGQYVCVVVEVWIAVEIVEVTFQAVDQRPGLQITSDLSAGQDTVGVRAAAAACADRRGVSRYEVGSWVDGAAKVRSARTASEVQPKITPAPLISGCLRRLQRQVGRDGGFRTASKRHCCRDEIASQ